MKIFTRFASFLAYWNDVLRRQFFFLVRRTGAVSLCLVSAVGSAEMTEQFLETEEAVGFQVPGVRLVASVLEFLHILILKYLLDSFLKKSKTVMVLQKIFWSIRKR